MRDGDTAEFPVFTFDNLVERARKGKFGENLTNPGDQVTLVITGSIYYLFIYIVNSSRFKLCFSYLYIFLVQTR